MDSPNSDPARRIAQAQASLAAGDLDAAEAQLHGIDGDADTAAQAAIEGARIALARVDDAGLAHQLESAEQHLEASGESPSASSIRFEIFELRLEREVHAGRYASASALVQRLPAELARTRSAAHRSHALRLAATAAEGMGRPREATEWVARALEEAAFTRQGDRRVEAFTCRAGLALGQGRFAAARADMDQAIIAMRAGVSPAVASACRASLAAMLMRLGSIDEAQEHVDLASRAASTLPRVAVSSALAMGEIAFAKGDFARAREALQRARALASAGESSRRLLIAALFALGDLNASLGDQRGAEECYRRITEDTVDEAPLDEVHAWLRLAALAVEFRTHDEAAASLATALDLARRIGDRSCQTLALGIHADLEARRGRLLSAASTLREGARLCEAAENVVGHAEFLRRHAEVATETGDMRAAEALLAEAVEVAAATGLPQLNAQALTALSYFHERRGNYPRALRELRRALQVLRGRADDSATWVGWLAIGSLNIERLHKVQRGRLVLDSVRRRAEAAGHEQLAAEARVRLAAGRAADGDVDVAYDLLLENVAFHAAIGDHRRHAASLLRLADLFLATLGNVDEGERLFSEASSVLEATGDLMELARCHRELGRRAAQLLEGRYRDGLYQIARGHLESAITHFRNLGVHLPRIDALLDLGDLHLTRRQAEDIEAARGHYETARKLAAESNYAAGLARYEACRARLAATGELFREALQHFEIARERYEVLGDLAGVFRVERARGEIQLMAGERSRAELSLKRALAVAERMGSLWDQRLTYHALHSLKSQMGDRPAAAQLAEQSRALDDSDTMRRFAEGKLRLYERLELDAGMQEALLDLIAAYLDDRDREAMGLDAEPGHQDALAETIARLQEMCRNDPRTRALAYRQLGDMYVEHGDLAQADGWYYEAFVAVRESEGARAAVALAEAIVETLDDVQDWGGVDRWLQRGLEQATAEGRDSFTVQLYNRFATYYRGRGRYEEALELLREGHQCARETQDPSGELDIAIALGELHHDLGDYLDAIAWFEIADRVCAEHGDARLRRDLALKIAGCHALAASSAEQDTVPASEVAGLRRQAQSWLETAKEREPAAEAAPSPHPPAVERPPLSARLSTPGEPFEGATEEEIRAETSSTIGTIFLDLRDEDSARQHYEDGARILDQSGYPGRHGDYLAMVGDRFREHGRWGTSAAWYRRAFFSYLSAGEPERALEVAGDVGAVFVDAGDPEMAVKFCDEATRCLGADVDADIRGRLTHLRARLERRASDDSVALSSMREAVGYLHSAGDIDRVVEVYDDIADILMKSGRRDSAVDSYRELLELIRGREDPQLLATIHSRIGGIHRKAGEFEDALESFEEALHVLKENGKDYDVAGALEDLALTHLDAENLEAALELFGEALQIYHRLEDLREIAWAHLWCCDIFLRQGDTVSARRRARLAERIFKSQRMTPALIEATIWVAQCDQSEGETESALEGLEYALARTKALPRDEDKLRPARFLYDMFTELGHKEQAEDCARLLQQLGDDPGDRGDDFADDDFADEDFGY